MTEASATPRPDTEAFARLRQQLIERADEASLAWVISGGLDRDKAERIIESAQGPRIRVGGREVLNFCANNYLGLSSHPDLIRAAHDGLEKRGFGMSSVRFICGTQDVHKELEQRISAFLGTDDTILYTSCFDANGGIFETLLGPEDAIIADKLNHASIIDGVRLAKAQRFIDLTIVIDSKGRSVGNT